MRRTPGSAAWMAAPGLRGGDGGVAFRALAVPDEIGNHVEAPALFGRDAVGVGQVVRLQELDIEYGNPFRLGALCGQPRQGEQPHGRRRRPCPPEPGGRAASGHRPRFVPVWRLRLRLPDAPLYCLRSRPTCPLILLMS